ncbi:MAG: transglycosylase SLT domain-containing protein [Acidimicrobiales bacterium]|nr:transglycosylase SLT domain-containing protein [Acidimicrobiales bacterium]
MTRQAAAATLVGLALVAGGCSGTDRPELTDTTLPPTTSAASTTSTTTATSTTEPPSAHPAAPNGRVYPSVPGDAEEAAGRLYELEDLLDTTDPNGPEWPDLAHEQQMLYRVIGRDLEWIAITLDGAPEEHRWVIERHLAARRAIADIGGGSGEPPQNAPAWEIIEPLSAEELRALYEEAEADTGVHWSFLAAINLLETGFGRIDGLSTAGAQGPMQFLPTTWEEVSDGDIDDPADAIPAAARYLVRRGGPDDMHRALWGYNNSDAYVAAVTHYATLFAADDRSFLAAHDWEIHYSAAIGDLWFPVGYRLEEPQPTSDYLEDAPWSAPPPRS